MRISEEFKRFDRLAFRHSILDGVSEMVLGLYLALLAALLHLVPVVLVAALGVFVLPAAVQFIQQRYISGRIGFVEPLPPPAKQLVGGMALYLIAVIAGAIAVLRLSGHELGALNQWYPVVAGFCCAGGFWYAASRSGLVRFRAHAIFAVSLGFVFQTLVDGSFSGLQPYFEVMGGYLLLSGVVVLVRFLHRYPVSVPRANGA